jgi:hypothetical protein
MEYINEPVKERKNNFCEPNDDNCGGCHNPSDCYADAKCDKGNWCDN